jgi:hypothetical protein
MRPIVTRIAAVAVAAVTATATPLPTVGTAHADPTKKTFPVHVWCPGTSVTVYTDTPYLTAALGAAPVWLTQPDGSAVKYAAVASAEYRVLTEPVVPAPTDYADGSGALFLFARSLGSKSGYGPTLHCVHFANWGTESEPFYLEGPLDLALLPSQD